MKALKSANTNGPMDVQCHFRSQKSVTQKSTLMLSTFQFLVLRNVSFPKSFATDFCKPSSAVSFQIHFQFGMVNTTNRLIFKNKNFLPVLGFVDKAFQLPRSCFVE